MGPASQHGALGTRYARTAAFTQHLFVLAFGLEVVCGGSVSRSARRRRVPYTCGLIGSVLLSASSTLRRNRSASTGALARDQAM